MIKKIGILSIAFVLFSLGLKAQKVEITPQYGYQFGAKYSYYGGYVKFQDSDQYGLTFGINAADDVTIEFMWAQQNSTVSVQDFLLYPRETDLTDITTNHYQIGAIYMFDDDQLRPIVGASAGWSTWNPEEIKYNSNTTFTMGLSGGLKYFFTDRIGLRFQGQLLLPVNWGGFYLGSGGSGVYASGSILLFNITGGLIIGLGD